MLLLGYGQTTSQARKLIHKPNNSYDLFYVLVVYHTTAAAKQKIESPDCLLGCFFAKTVHL